MLERRPRSPDVQSSSRKRPLPSTSGDPLDEANFQPDYDEPSPSTPTPSASTSVSSADPKPSKPKRKTPPKASPPKTSKPSDPDPSVSESASCDDDDSRQVALEDHEVLDWIINSCPKSCLSPGKDKEEHLVYKLEPASLPLHPMVRTAFNDVNAEVAKLTTNQSLKPTAYRDASFRHHGAPFLEKAAKHDEALKRLGSSTSDRFSVSDSLLQGFDMEARRAIKPLSALLHLAEGIQADTTKDNPDRLEILNVLMRFQSAALAKILDHLRSIITQSTLARRSATLSSCGWAQEFKDRLTRAPVDSQFLFDGTIPEIHKEHAAVVSTELQTRAVDQILEATSQFRPHKKSKRRSTFQGQRSGFQVKKSTGSGGGQRKGKKNPGRKASKFAEGQRKDKGKSNSAAGVQNPNNH